MKPIILKIIISLLAVLAPIQSMLITALALIGLDLVLGLMAAKKSATPITSAGLRRTIVKLFVYEMAIVIGFVTQHYLMNDALPVTNIVTSFIGMTEMLSCMENLNTISGGQLLKSLLEKLNSVNK